MAKQGEAAYAYFLKGYNCSQSVVAAFAPQLGLSEEMALRMSAGFGAGIGRMLSLIHISEPTRPY